MASYNDKNDKPGNAILLNGAVGTARPPAERGSVGGDFKSANREIGAPGWHSRGYLPHFDSVNVSQHVTFHLSDSLPQTVLQRLDAELKSFPKAKRDIERRKRSRRGSTRATAPAFCAIQPSPAWSKSHC